MFQAAELADEALVNPADQIAQGRRARGCPDRAASRRRSRRALRLVGIAIELGFLDEVRTAGPVHFKPSGAEPSRDGHDAELNVIRTAADAEPRGAAFLDLGRAGRVGMPEDGTTFRKAERPLRLKCADVFVEGCLPLVAFLDDPEDIIARAKAQGAQKGLLKPQSIPPNHVGLPCAAATAG